MQKFTDQVKIANNLRLISADKFTVNFKVEKEAYDLFKEEVADEFSNTLLSKGKKKISTIEQFTGHLKKKL
jgi:hypothetical protein